MLSNFGGFMDAIIFIASSFMTFYSFRMFSADVARNIPLAKRGESPIQEKTRELRDKLAS